MNSDNLVGITLGNRYDMLEKIGTGGMATVYKAKDTLLNRFVAIKILRDSLEDEKQVVSNFIKEAQSSASLVHNNIVSVYDVGEENGLNYMVMEYVDGITLKEYIKHKGALPWQEACDFAIQIGQGIGEAHSINIIHRDIKPQNILMTKDKTLKVTDFGIARAVAGETTVVGGSALGSVHYISPEQARGGFTDDRSDIYSLGIVLYEMLTGKVPFDGDTAVSVALMHLEKEPVNVKCVNLDIPTDLAYVTMKSISKEQRARYQNVQELVDDLHAVLADEPLPSREEMYRKSVQENDDIDVSEVEDDFDEDDLDVPEILSDNYSDNENQRIRTKRKEEVKKKSKNKKKEDRIAIVLGISTVVVIALIAMGIIFFINGGKNVTVPDFTNMTVEQAMSEAKRVGVQLEEEYSLSDTIEENHIISQDPEARKVVKKNEKIKIVVSIGSSGGNIAAPDLSNRTVEEAIEIILAADLKYFIVEEDSAEKKAGEIIRQTPLAGTKMNKDDIITLHVSKGKNSQPTPGKQVSVPSVVGLSIDHAETILSKNGLSIGNVLRAPSSSTEGTIIRQTPEVGKTTTEGSRVDIVVAKKEESSQQTEKPSATEAPSNNESNGNGGNNDDTPPVTQKKTVSFKIPDDAGESVSVEIVANGRTIHSAVHSKSDGVVSVDIMPSSGAGTVEVQAYMDGVNTSSINVNFD